MYTRFLLLTTSFFFFGALLHAQGQEAPSSSNGPARGSVSIGMQYLVDGDTKPPAIKPSSPGIDYPELALLTGMNGVVELDILVGETGAVENVEVRKSDDSVFTKAAVEGVKKFEFSPATIGGTPVGMTVMMEVKFTTEDQWTAVYDDSGERPEGEESDSWAYVGDATLPEMDQKAFQENLVYPEDARVKELQGTVTIRARIGRDGSVVETQVQGKADPMLAKAAIEAITKTPFTPGMEGGEPAEMWTIIPVNFTISHGLTSKPVAKEPEEDAEETGSVRKPTFDQAELEGHFFENFSGTLKEAVEVRMRVLINEDGGVTQVLAPDNTNAMVANAAVQAVKQTGFTPGMQEGKPIPVWITVSFKATPRGGE